MGDLVKSSTVLHVCAQNRLQLEEAGLARPVEMGP